MKVWLVSLGLFLLASACTVVPSGPPVKVADCIGDRKFVHANAIGGIRKWIRDHLPDARICDVQWTGQYTWVVTYQQDN